LIIEGQKIVEALGEMLAPLVEVVLHDLTNPEHAIVAIANNLSGRNVGDATSEITLARVMDPNFPAVVQSYPKRFPDGRPAKSTSIVADTLGVARSTVYTYLPPKGDD
jgi:predicted transcriptional regulator YheO